MPTKRAALSRFAVPLIAYLLLVIPASIYYFFYTQSQSEYFAARNFRQLWVLTEQLRFTLNNYRKILENSATAGDPQKYLQSFVTELRVLKVQTGLPVEARPFHVDLEEWDGSWHIVLSYANPNTRTAIRAERDMAMMLRGLADSDFFDDVFLAGPGGNVVFQTARSGLRFSTLEALPIGAPSKPSGLLSLVSSAPPAATGERAALRGGSRLFAGVELSGKRYDIYLQPLQVAYSGAGGTSAEWTICALVRSRRFARESLAISYDLILAFVSGLMLIILTLPLLKVRSLTAWEPLRFRDLVALFVCTCSIASLLVMLALHLFHFEVRQEPNEDQLKAVAGLVTGRLKTELQDLNVQLRQFCRSNDLRQDMDAIRASRMRAGWQPGAAPAAGQTVARRLITAGRYPNLKFAVWADAAGWQWIKWSVREAVTPFINVEERLVNIRQGRTWILPGDPENQPYRVEIIVSQNTGEYLATYLMRTEDCIGPALAGEDPLLQSGYSYIATELSSLMKPVLPPDTGFAVLDQLGRTVIHSDAAKNQWEDFFLETDEDERLRAAVRARSSMPLKIRYQGREHEAYVDPMVDVLGDNYSLVLFRDVANIRTMHLETQTLAAFLLVPYLLLLTAAGILCLWLASPRYPAAWIWPDPKNSQAYRTNIVICFGFLLTMLVCTIVMPPAPLYFGVVTLGSLAAILCFYVLGTRAKWIGGAGQAILRWKLQPASEYALAATLLIGVVGVVPCIACFRIAYDLELELLVRAGQMKMAQNVKAKLTDARRKYDANQGEREHARRNARPGETVQLLPGFDANAFVREESQYLSPFFGTTVVAGESAGTGLPDRQTSFRRFLAVQRVAYNKGATQTSGIPLSIDSTRWSWVPGTWPVLRFPTHRPGSAPAKEPILVQTEVHSLAEFGSPVSAYRSVGELGFWLLLTVSVLTGVFFAMRGFVRWVAMMPFAEVEGSRAGQTIAAAAGVAATAAIAPAPVQPISAETAVYATLESSADHYERLWKERSAEERFVLYRLALDGVVNPVNAAVLYRLLRAGLIVARPRFEIFDEAFRMYLLQSVRLVEIRGWASHRAQGGTHSGRTVTLVLALGALGFLLLTQPELLQSSAGFLSAIAATLGALMKLLPSQGESSPSAVTKGQ